MLRAQSKASATSTTDSATCEATRIHCKRKRWRPAVMPRPLFLSADPGAAPLARRTGTKPKKSVVRTASAAVNPSTRQSVGISRKNPLPGVPRNAIITWLSGEASSPPQTAPGIARSALSESNCGSVGRAKRPAQAGRQFHARAHWPVRAAGSPRSRRRPIGRDPKSTATGRTRLPANTKNHLPRNAPPARRPANASRHPNRIGEESWRAALRVQSIRASCWRAPGSTRA